MITKAIIPAGGWGTRRLPITKTIEKSMLPVGNRPIIDYVVQDCIAAGITEIFFVVAKDSTQVQSYYSQNLVLESYLRANGKEAMIPEITPPAGISFHYVFQDTNDKYGTAIPVALTAGHINEGESVVVLMGDDFVYNADGSSEVARLVQAAEGSSAILGVRVAKEQVSRYGVLEIGPNNEFIRIVEKPSVDEAPSDLINVSKYVLTYDLLKEVESFAATTRDGEYQITDAINEFVARGGVLKVVGAEGQFLDGGTLEGWLHANQVVIGA